MKTLNCTMCGKYLGEIEKGRIKLGTTLTCQECIIGSIGSQKDGTFEYLLNILKGAKK